MKSSIFGNMEDSPYRQFAFSRSKRRFLEPIPGYSILGTQNGDSEIRVLPGARRKMIPGYFSPTVCPLFLDFVIDFGE